MYIYINTLVPYRDKFTFLKKTVMFFGNKHRCNYEIIWKKYEEGGEKYIIKSFIRCTLHHIVLGMK